MAYSDAVLDHYENPRNVGKMDDKDVNNMTLTFSSPFSFS
jgi:nitrogen fixation NifU-like protein